MSGHVPYLQHVVALRIFPEIHNEDILYQ